MSLKLSDISKNNGEQAILRGVSIEVAPGEIFGLLGADGAGKTAILNLIRGAEQSDSGSISFEGKDFTADRQKPRDFAFSEHESTFARELQSAEKVLLLDNPFCCLDENGRDEMLEELRRTAKEKSLCVVLATSDHSEAFAVCDRVGVLHASEIVQTGAPRELYEKPANAAVARALGRGNFIEARRVALDNQTAQEFQTIDGGHRLQTGATRKDARGVTDDSVTLHIRPEYISISFGASFPEDNLLKAKIVRVQYQGATTRVKLSAAGLMLEALVLRLVGLNVGDECLVGLPPDRIAVLSD